MRLEQIEDEVCASAEIVPSGVAALPSSMIALARAITSCRPVNTTPPMVFSQRDFSRRTAVPSSETSSTVESLSAAEITLRSREGTSCFIRLKVAITEMFTHCSLLLAVSACMNLSLAKLASEK